MLKRILIFFILLSLQIIAFAQSVQVQYPYVESAYTSQYGKLSVAGVVVKNGETLVLIENITTRYAHDLWTSFSDNTTLSYSGGTYKIKYWGYWDGEDVQRKNFNQKYSLQSDRRYFYVLAFPSIPTSTKVISVVENISGGYYWKGIHLSSDAGNSSSLPDNNDNYSYRREERTRPFIPTGSGTCFAINKEGYLVTCYHVIDDAREIRIRGVNGNFSKLLRARVVASDIENDIAILKIDDTDFSGLNNIPFSISDKVADVGENAYVLGYPLRAIMGDEIKLTNGLISSLSGYQGDITSYQTSAAVQAGNSGGPLFDKYGAIIGVVNARLNVESVSYAVKSSHLFKLASANNIAFNKTSSISSMTLTEQVKRIRDFVYIIETQ